MAYLSALVHRRQVRHCERISSDASRQAPAVGAMASSFSRARSTRLAHRRVAPTLNLRERTNAAAANCWAETGRGEIGIQSSRSFSGRAFSHSLKAEPLKAETLKLPVAGTSDAQDANGFKWELSRTRRDATSEGEHTVHHADLSALPTISSRAA